jgi:class 3 adenylate cyclase/tetratricopeptide (TPR) repeat protein
MTAATPAGPPGGQLRRLTLMFCDLVGSTALSTRHEPEQYRTLLSRYKQACQQVVEDTYDGHIAKVKGDGLLVLFGHPSAHEDDVLRAVRAGLDLVAAIRRLSEVAEREVGETLAARVAVHRGPVYLDPDEDDVYGLAANVAARLQELAPPASVVVSAEVVALVGDRFDVRPQEAEKVKGLDEPLASWRVVAERSEQPERWRPTGGWTTPLVGRDEPLDQLRLAWRDRPGTVLVRGDAGIGKSRLVAALADEVAAAGARVVEVAAVPDAAAAGFQPLRVLIERGCRIRPAHDGGERLRRLRLHLAAVGLDHVGLVPLLAPVVGVGPDAGYAEAPADTSKLLADITDALGGYLRARLGDGPCLLVVEDAHWLDPSTRDVLVELRRSLPAGVLVAMTARGHAAPLAADVVDLAPLSPDECQVVADALDPGGATAGDRRRLVVRSDGVPLYLEHLVRTAVDLAPAGGVRPPGRAAGEVPDALYEPLVARLDATPGGVHVAGAAATIGREVDRALLARVVDVDDVALDRVVTALVAGSVLDAPAEPGGPYRFRHGLLREVAYELQPPSARQQAHGRVADALAAEAATAAGGTADWRVLAGHYEQARRIAAAVDCLRRSAEQARRRGGLAEARADLDRALALLADLPDPERAHQTDPETERAERADVERVEREVDLRLRRGFLAVSTEGNASPGAAADYQRCLELATAGRSGDATFTTLIALWGHYASRGDLARAAEVLETLRRAVAGGRDWARPENDAGFGMLDWYAGRFPDAADRLEQAARAAEERGDDNPVRAEWFLPNDPRTAIYTHLGLARFLRGDPAGATAAFATADRLAAELSFPQGPFSAAYNLTYAAWTRTQMGDHERAAEAVDRVQSLADRHGFDFWSLAAATQRAELAVADPPDRDALAVTADVLAGLVTAWQVIDTRVFLPAALTSCAAALAATGQRDAAAQRCAEALAVAAETGARFCAAETQRVQAHLATDPAAVDEGLRAALAVAIDQGAVPFRLRIARDLQARASTGVSGTDADEDLRDALDQFAPGASYPELDATRALLA